MMAYLETESRRRLRPGVVVFLCFLAFFTVIALVNAGFIMVALDSHSGVVTEKSYEKGLAFDETLKKAKLQMQAGYRHNVNFENNILRFELKDKEGAPVTGGRVSGKMVRPVKAGYDFDVELQEVGPGVYQARLTMPHKGLWEVQLKGQWQARKDQVTSYQVKEKIIIK